MFKDITIGQYISGNSLIHRLDARLKILSVFAFIILLFLISDPIAYAIYIIFTLIIVFLTKIPVKYILKGLKPMLFIIAFTVIINLFLTPGDVLWEQSLFFFTIKITLQGIKMSIIMFIRLVLLVSITSLLTLTTKPLMLTNGIEKILSPFKKFKLPAHEIAMMMSIAIRFIPTLAEETDKIIKAQKARGADFESGNIFMRAKAMIPLLVPLFVSAFRRADELATAMDARCYNGGEHRTKLTQMKFNKIDYYAVFCICIFSGLLIFTEYFI